MICVFLNIEEPILFSREQGKPQGSFKDKLLGLVDIIA